MKFHKESYLTFYLEQNQKDCLGGSSIFNYTLLLYQYVLSFGLSNCSGVSKPLFIQSQSSYLYYLTIHAGTLHGFTVPQGVLKMEFKKTQSKTHEASQIFARHPSIAGPSVNDSSNSWGISLFIDTTSSTHLPGFVRLQSVETYSTQ